MASQLLKLEYPFFAVIAAIFSMENSIANSYKAGLYRLLGTFVGAFVGVILIAIQPGNPILMGIGTLLLIFICNMFKWDRAVPIAGVVFASVMLSLNNKNPLHYSFSRIFDTFIGIVIAVIVNYTIFPPNNIAQIQNSVKSISKKISQAISNMLCHNQYVDLFNLRNEVIDTVKFLETYKIEYKTRKNKRNDIITIDKKLDFLRNIIAHLLLVAEMHSECSISPENIEKLKSLKHCEISTNGYLENKRNIVYNYHLEKLLEALPHLT